MRLLFLTGEFPPLQGGVGDCTNEIARALVKRGLDVTVLTSVRGESTQEDAPVTPDEVAPLLILRRVAKWDWSARSLIRETIQETRADVVHIQYQTAAFGMHPMINFAPRLFKPFLSTAPHPKSVVTFHDLLPMYLFPKAGGLRNRVTFQLARDSDAVIATNEQDFARLFKLKLAQLSLIPIGSNVDPTPPPGYDREAVRARLGVAPDELLWCYFGFLNASKGGETLIRALAQMPNAKLLMLGGQTGASDPTNAAYLTRIKGLIQELGLQNRVLWTDFMAQPQVSAHFLASDVCVLPYRDGASFRRGTLMAALAHGMAIVTTTPQEPVSAQLPGLRLPRLVDGENVLLVPPDSPAAIVAAVQRIAASPALRTKLQEGARQTAQYFTWDRIADAHLELYQRLISTAR